MFVSKGSKKKYRTGILYTHPSIDSYEQTVAQCKAAVEKADINDLKDSGIANFNIVSGNNKSLIYTCITSTVCTDESKKLEMIQFLYENGVSPSSITTDGLTCIMQAVAGKYVDIFKWLLQHAPDTLHNKDILERDAIHHAIFEYAKLEKQEQNAKLEEEKKAILDILKCFDKHMLRPTHTKFATTLGVRS